MEILSERLSILKKDELLSIVILPDRNRARLGLMFLWLFAWTVCGVIVMANFFRIPDRESKVFILVYLAFWAYFEVSIMRAYVWRRFGREKIWISHGKLHYQRETYGRGKVREYLTEMVSPMRLIELRQSNFLDFIGQSFWVRGGERIEFNTQGKTLRLGMQLSDEEGRAVVTELNRALREA